MQSHPNEGERSEPEPAVLSWPVVSRPIVQERSDNNRDNDKYIRLHVCKGSELVRYMQIVSVFLCGCVRVRVRVRVP